MIRLKHQDHSLAFHLVIALDLGDLPKLGLDLRKNVPPQVDVREWSDDKRVLLVSAWTATADYHAVQDSLLEELGATLERRRQQSDRPSSPARP